MWNAAYSATSVSQRSLDKIKELEEQEQRDKEEHDKAILESLDAKLKEIEDIQNEYKL